MVLANLTHLYIWYLMQGNLGVYGNMQCVLARFRPPCQIMPRLNHSSQLSSIVLARFRPPYQIMPRLNHSSQLSSIVHPNHQAIAR